MEKNLKVKHVVNFLFYLLVIVITYFIFVHVHNTAYNDGYEDAIYSSSDKAECIAPNVDIIITLMHGHIDSQGTANCYFIN